MYHLATLQERRGKVFGRGVATAAISQVLQTGVARWFISKLK
jgi:hypothetical protein